MKKKNIFDKESLCVFAVFFLLFGLVNIGIYYVCIGCPWIQEHISLSADAARSITSMQITISLVSITIMTLFLGSANERILGISYKRIFFKKDFFRFFNITHCVFLMLIFIVCSVVSSLFLINLDYSKVCLFGKIVCIVSLFFSIFLLFKMISLGLILKYKQSNVYNKIYWNLKNKKNLNTYHEIVEKIDVFMIEENEYRQYIIEECIIYSHICLNISDFESNINEQKRILQKIISKIGELINKDPRDNAFLLIKLYKAAEEIFEKDKTKDLFCCNFKV